MTIKRVNFDFCYLFLSGIMLAGMYCFPEIVREAASNGISICLKKIIPTLLPYIIATKMFSLFLLKISVTNPHFSKIKPDVLILLSGNISGFPNGAVLTSNFYKSGAISKKKAEIIISCSNSISPAFCISVFGADVLNRGIYGIITFISIIAVNISLYLLQTRAMNDENNTISISHGNKSYSSLITSAITEGFEIIIDVCAFVVYFFTIGSIFHTIMTFAGLEGTVLDSAVCSVLEITGGIEQLKNLKYGTRFILGNAAMGFGGLSAIMQVLSVCNNDGLSSRRFLFAKIISLFAVPVISFIILYLIPENVLAGSLSSAYQIIQSWLNKDKIILFGSLLIAIIAIIVINNRKENKKSKIFL